MKEILTYRDVLALIAQDADNFDKVVIPSMKSVVGIDRNTREKENYPNVGAIILLCDGTELFVSRQLASEMLTKGYFQKHNLPIVVSADLSEMDRDSRSSPSEDE